MTTSTKILLEGMDCSDCELVLEHRLSRLEGVQDVHADFQDQSLAIEYDPQRIRRRDIDRRIRQMGYEPVQGRIVLWLNTNRELLLSLLSGFLLLGGWLAERSDFLPLSVVNGLYVAAYFPAGVHLARETFGALLNRRFDIDLLMFAAGLGAAVMGEYAEGALLFFLFSLGHALQDRALDRARGAVRSLADLAPRMAVVRQGTRDVVVPVEKLTLRDIVVVRPGERVPVDGEVTAGVSYVNEAALTGESLPVHKSGGDRVLAGSLNSDGTLEVAVSRLAKDSTLARVMKLVEQAQASRSPAQLWVDRFTRLYVPFVLLVFVGLLALPVLSGEPFKQGFMRAVVFLVATSPCALALGTPSALLSGVAQAARNGILVKGGVYLENLGRLKAIAFDKTGTLTVGEPHVTDVFPEDGWTAEGVMQLALSIEGRLTHPLAQAITGRALELGLVNTPADALENLTGRGARASLNGRQVWIGSRAMWVEQGPSLSAGLEQAVSTLESQGKTAVLVGMDDQAVGLIGIADLIRPESHSTLRELARLGIQQTVMLSGDNPRSAAAVAHKIGIEKFEAGLMPEDKLEYVRDLVEEYGYVGMVGDGVNDAPALAQATVGIALGSARNDVALEAADVALMSADLSKLPFAVGLGKALQRITLQNMAFSFASILVLVALSLAGFLSIGGTVFLHEGATLLVVGNALRLFAYRGS